MCLRASHKNLGREAVFHAFNSSDSNVQILFTSLRIWATSINLQADCSDIIYVDVPMNSQTALQATGRVGRIRQSPHLTYMGADGKLYVSSSPPRQGNSKVSGHHQWARKFGGDRRG